MKTRSIPALIAPSTWPCRAFPVIANIGSRDAGNFPSFSHCRMLLAASSPSLKKNELLLMKAKGTITYSTGISKSMRTTEGYGVSSCCEHASRNCKAVQ